MPRRPRAVVGGLVYHVLNRSNAGATLFRNESEFASFERVLEEAHQRHPVRIVSYCLMPNHWHFALWPRIGEERDLSAFMAWLTMTHSQRWHHDRGTVGSGHVYQGRFKTFPVQTDSHLLTVLRYIERNPLRASLVALAEQWRWSSLGRRLRAAPGEDPLLSRWPVDPPTGWLRWVNEPQSAGEVAAIQSCINPARPFGDEAWSHQFLERLGPDFIARPPGRPRKPAPVPGFLVAP